MPISSTQIGTIGENLLINAIMKASDGRLSPFQPVADDDGIDVLFFDKATGHAVAVQLKCRTRSLFKPGTQDRGNGVHFEVRKATFNDARRAHLVAGLLNEEMTQFVAMWFLPMIDLPTVARDGGTKWVIRPSKAAETRDRFVPYRCTDAFDLAQRIFALCDTSTKDSDA
ncbi:hypothetical protein [Sphingopyxis sp.]|uniref:hypothetical protein n=1 Tax=Sphingopyxis sp. TaxID=1908224 RepID=UPI003D0DAD1D